MEQILHASSILIPFGLCLRMSLKLLYGARGPQLGDPVYQVINAASWTLLALAGCVFIVSGTLWLSVFLLMACAFAAREWISARRAMQRQSAWMLVAGGLGSAAPSPAALRNHWRRFTGVVGRSLRQLTAKLTEGVPLAAAIGRHCLALPREAQAFAALEAAGVSDFTRAATGETARPLPSIDNLKTTAGQQLYQRLSYLVGVLVIMTAIVSFIIVKIVPSYQAIFQDFEMNLPRITVWLIGAANMFVQLGEAILSIPVWLFQAAAFAANTPIGQILNVLFAGLLMAGILLALLKLCALPFYRFATDWLFLSSHRSLVLQLLAIAAEQGVDFRPVLRQLADGKQRYPSSLIRERLRLAGKGMDSGRDWRAALHMAGLIKGADLPLLESAQAAGNLPWVLRMLADQKVRTMVFRWSAVEQIAFPLAVLALGMLVALICVALFWPLVDLIYNLA